MCSSAVHEHALEVIVMQFESSSRKSWITLFLNVMFANVPSESSLMLSLQLTADSANRSARGRRSR